jgi:hypothetical protein
MASEARSEDRKARAYLLNIYQPDGPPPSSVALDKIMRDVNALLEETKASGAWVFNGGLFPANSSTVVRSDAGERLVTDGPFVEGKEHVGGFLIVRADDLDGALRWAEKLSRATTLPIEVRPFQHVG